MTRPVATVIVPARDEVHDIAGCIDAIALQDVPAEDLEVLVVDGGSTDGTNAAAEAALDRYRFAEAAVITNLHGSTSSNLNLGLRLAKGDVVCRVDARTRIEPHYVRTCVQTLGGRPEVAVVGGAQVAVARDQSATAVGIARALNNRWSMGGSRYRRATTSGASDTVYLGAFRRDQLLGEGGWDEALVSNQDFDLNQRMSTRGLVWLDASLRSSYLPRGDLRQLWRQYRRFGRAKVRYWRHASAGPQARQWVLLVAPPAVVAGGGLWLLVAPPRATAILGCLAVAGAFAVEALGIAGSPARVTERAMGVAAMAVVSGGWWLGVAQEVVSPRPERLGSDLRGAAS